MLGILRFILAVMVALSHVGGNFGELWNGVIAVIVFYMISGYAMTGLISKRFPTTNAAFPFYFERIVRLAPQYYFWLMLALIFSLVLKWYPYKVDVFCCLSYEAFAYFTVIPLGLQSYFGSVDALILPQATTLAIEITLYIFSPWILKSLKLSWLAAIISLIIFLATAIGKLPPNTYTYFSSPGPVVFYILGSLLYRKEWVSLSVLVFTLISILIFSLPQRLNTEFLLGVCIGLPLIAFLIRFKPNKIDSAFGNASYGCFLGHGIVFFTLTHFFGEIDNAIYRVIATLLACLAGWLSFYVIEKPTLPFRRLIKSSGGSN
ncbi:MAG: hypothetical protein CTY29_02500 [Methylobacter sp.]|nr:MAG: hypothetical protein CTY29_02500 [Methylobacter sp.]